MRKALVLLLAVFIVRGSSASGQAVRSTAGSGVVDGTAVDSAGHGIPFVEIVFLDHAAGPGRTSPGGGYRIEDVPSGAHVVRFRRLGFQPLTMTVDVTAGEILGLDPVLTAVPHQLAEVTVQDSAGEIFRLPLGVGQRMRSGQGSYITYDQIRRIRPIRTAELFQRVPGVEVTPSGSVNNTRGVISITLPVCQYGMWFYLDGIRMNDPHMGADTTGGTALADLIDPKEIVAIEVYRGPAEIPPDLPSNPCGAVFIWSRR